jgi:hypothetical protein
MQMRMGDVNISSQLGQNILLRSFSKLSQKILMLGALYGDTDLSGIGGVGDMFCGELVGVTLSACFIL